MHTPPLSKSSDRWIEGWNCPWFIIAERFPDILRRIELRFEKLCLKMICVNTGITIQVKGPECDL